MSGIEIKKADGVYRTPLLKNVIPEPGPEQPKAQGALAAAHWDGRLNCRLAIDIGWAGLGMPSFYMLFHAFWKACHTFPRRLKGFEKA